MFHTDVSSKTVAKDAPDHAKTAAAFAAALKRAGLEVTGYDRDPKLTDVPDLPALVEALPAGQRLHYQRLRLHPEDILVPPGLPPTPCGQLREGLTRLAQANLDLGQAARVPGDVAGQGGRQGRRD